MVSCCFETLVGGSSCGYFSMHLMISHLFRPRQYFCVMFNWKHLVFVMLEFVDSKLKKGASLDYEVSQEFLS